MMREVGQRIDAGAGFPGHYPLEGRETVPGARFDFFISGSGSELRVVPLNAGGQIPDHGFPNQLGSMRDEFLFGRHAYQR